MSNKETFDVLMRYISGDGVLKVDNHYYEKEYLRKLIHEINLKATLVEVGLGELTECERFTLSVLTGIVS